MSPKRPHRRTEERLTVAMPVSLNGHAGITRDVSASGVYFEFDQNLNNGSEISFEIEVASESGPMRLKCQGIVVRTEKNAEKTGVAVKITESTLEALQ